MGDYLLDQLVFVRNLTLYSIQGMGEEEADLIPEGFNNNIRWNLGHIYVTQEQLAFQFAEEPVEIPEGFLELFGRGSKPSDWNTHPPTLPELSQLLKDQPQRIREKLGKRLDERVEKPFTLAGYTLYTIGNSLSFGLTHEGAHAQSIKMIKRFNEK